MEVGARLSVIVSLRSEAEETVRAIETGLRRHADRANLRFDSFSARDIRQNFDVVPIRSELNIILQMNKSSFSRHQASDFQKSIYLRNAIVDKVRKSTSILVDWQMIAVPPLIGDHSVAFLGESSESSDLLKLNEVLRHSSLAIGMGSRHTACSILAGAATDRLLDYCSFRQATSQLNPDNYRADRNSGSPRYSSENWLFVCLNKLRILNSNGASRTDGSGGRVGRREASAGMFMRNASEVFHCLSMFVGWRAKQAAATGVNTLDGSVESPELVAASIDQSICGNLAGDPTEIKMSAKSRNQPGLGDNRTSFSSARRKKSKAMSIEARNSIGLIVGFGSNRDDERQPDEPGANPPHTIERLENSSRDKEIINKPFSNLESVAAVDDASGISVEDGMDASEWPGEPWSGSVSMENFSDNLRRLREIKKRRRKIADISPVAPDKNR